jgi:ATP-dependent DNA helicase RecG
LYGSVSIDMLGSEDQVSTSRNRTLAAILSDLPLPNSRGETICENRGSGIPQVMASLREAGMSPPTFETAPAQVKVTVPQHALLSPDIIEWIGSLGARGLTDIQHLALAMMRTTGRATNPMLQAWGVDSTTAGLALRDLITRGLCIRSGGRRYASYQLANTGFPYTLPFDLAGSIAKPAGSGVQGQRDAIVQALRAGHNTTRALSDALGINHRTVTRRIAELVSDGIIEPTHALRSRNQSYRLTNKEAQ